MAETQVSTIDNQTPNQNRISIKGNSSQYVKLNVGGSIHFTTIGTLTKNDTMLRAMFSGHMEVVTDTEGFVLIDRSGKHFDKILNFLRDGVVSLPESQQEIAELLSEANYYCIEDLSKSCERALVRRHKICCPISLITSSKEEQILIESTQKPIIKLLINRHNNKYSYALNSDDNLLKNIEVFDKMALWYSNRIVFVKDVISSGEICWWGFYGHGRKISEVCCTSILYGTDKKHTKVEFPEARIFEEALNILLYESRTAPDVELIQATSRIAVSRDVISDDEDERNCLERLRANKQSSAF